MNMILEFTSPDDDDRFRAAWHGLDLIATLQDVDEHLRSSLKYRTDKPSADTRAAWEAMRAHLCEAAAANGVAWIFE